MARRLWLTNKRLRGKKRRLRALASWSQSFENYFPTQISENEQYWNIKIPVDLRLVQGKQTNKTIQAQCAQYLIDAAYQIFLAKPSNLNYRVTCVICLPSMFTSEICIYTSEQYFQFHTKAWDREPEKLDTTLNRSLAQEWGLILPEGFSEKGILRSRVDECDDKEFFVENWYFGEVI
jgi:hypothetical protein